MMFLLGVLLVFSSLSSCVTADACPTRQTLIGEEKPQYISSPNYPGYYGAAGKRLSCAWLIYANASYDDVVIEMFVHNSSLEPATGCWRDSVEVIDGDRDFHSPLKSWCGSSGPSGTFTTSGSKALVKFNTNFKDNNYYGFLMSYWIVKKHKFVVNHQPLTAINYLLIAISVILLGSLPFGLLIILFARTMHEGQSDMEKRE